MAYTNLLGDYYRHANQRRVATGFGLTSQESAGALDAALANDLQLKREAQSYELNNRNLLLREKEQQNAANAARTSGYGQLAMLPLAYGAAKSAGMLPKGFQLTSPSTWGGTTAPATTAPNLMGTTTAQGAVAPVAATTAQGTVAAGEGMAAGGAGAASNVAAAAPTTSVGLLGSAGTVALPAAAGAVGGNLLGNAIGRATGMHPKTAGAVGGIVGGAAAGAYAGSVYPGVGTLVGGVIGGIVGGISSLF